MIIIGITGGIGSGKTAVAELFQVFRIPVYIADIEAKRLMHSSAKIRSELVSLLGEEVYLDGVLQREFVAKKIFSNQELLQEVNRIVHPVVRADFKEWAFTQQTKAIAVESAILFESGLVNVVDKVVSVTAALDERIARVMIRDGATEDQVRKRIQSQINDSERIAQSDFVISNNEEEPIIPQLLYFLTQNDLL